MSFLVESTRRAEQDVNQILAWLFERSPDGAAAWFEAWQGANAFLADHPYAAVIAP